MLTEDAANMLISDFGESVTVHPQAEDVPEDTSDPIYFQQDSSGDSPFSLKVRMYSAPSEEMLQRYGFDEDTEAVLYETDNQIEEGDQIEYNNQKFLIRRTVTNQIGNGPYIWIHDLVGL
jgi:hypothetical protein